MAMLRTTSSGRRCRPSGGLAVLRGSARQAIAMRHAPIGTLTAKSHGHDATESTPAAIDGPATEATATVMELSAMPRPSSFDG